MEQIEKVDLKSLQISEDIKAQLKAIMPQVFSEGKIDFEKLKLTLGEEISDSEERFGLQWPGKKDCFKVIQEPSIGTLKPCKEESINWDTTENLFIEGDNLEVLKQLQKSYYGKVKMIYIDPPYNTGSDFVYKDSFGDNIKNYLDQTGQTDEEGFKMSTNNETDGRFHSNWLNMMYPRLFLARNLLKNDGVIFISIDENEYYNLKNICDEIFGLENHRNTLIVQRRKKSLNSQFEYVRKLNLGYEYIVIYSKSEDFIYNNPTKPAGEDRKNGYWNSFWNNADRPTMRYEIAGLNINKGQWKWSKERAFKALENYYEYKKEFDVFGTELKEYWLKHNNEYFKKYNSKMEFIMPTETTIKYWVTPSETTILDTNLMHYYVNDDTGKKKYGFDTVKNLDLITKLVELGSDKDSLVLDFFAGSGTTAEAVSNLNTKDKGTRKFILVQLPEPNNNIENGKISDLTVNRLKIKQIDFRKFSLDISNFISWDGNLENNKIENQLKFAIESVKQSSSEFDLLYEILIKSGFLLTEKIVLESTNFGEIYIICDGALIICLEKKLTNSIIEYIAKKEPARVILADSGFNNNDELKTNAVQIMKSHNINDFKTI